MKILAYPRRYVIEIKDRILADESVAIISINGWDEEGIFIDSPRILSLWFDDIGHYDKIPPNIEEIYPKLSQFNSEYANAIIDFIKQLDLSKIKYIIVHCHAGISRSGAVARFLDELFHDEESGDSDKEWFEKNNRHIIPNVFVLNTLRRVYYGPEWPIGKTDGFCS
jgi:predicted protein tyrosine phosphatase